MRAAIRKAKTAWSTAVYENLVELQGEEILLENTDGYDGLVVSYVKDEYLIDVVLDKIRYDKQHGNIEVHVISVDGDEADEWKAVSWFELEQVNYIYDNIIWGDDEEVETEENVSELSPAELSARIVNTMRAEYEANFDHDKFFFDSDFIDPNDIVGLRYDEEEDAVYIRYNSQKWHRETKQVTPNTSSAELVSFCEALECGLGFYVDDFDEQI